MVRALVKGLRSVLTVAYVPLHGVVAIMDTTAPVWALHLDSNSPTEDHCWAMIDVLKVLRLGPHAAEHATRPRGGDWCRVDAVGGRGTRPTAGPVRHRRSGRDGPSPGKVAQGLVN